MLQGIAPTPTIELKIKPQEKGSIYGNDFIYQHYGKAADLHHPQISFFSSPIPTHCTATKKGVS